MTSEAALLETGVGTPSPWGAVRSWRRSVARSQWGLRIGLVIVGIYVAVAVLAPVIAPADPDQQNIPISLEGPSWHHLIGTDSLGRDEFSRLVFADRYDLFLAVCSTGLALLIGAALGVLTGYFRGILDTVVSRLIDLLMAIPLYPLLVLMLFVLGSGSISVVIVLAVTDWVGYARLSRSQAFIVREQNYIAAATLGGLRSPRVMARHLLPNVSAQLVVLWSSDIVMAIGTIAALGYLGIGIQPPTAEWGVMVQDGQNYLLTDWWLSFAPGVAIAVLGVGLALISDAIAGKGQDLMSIEAGPKAPLLQVRDLDIVLPGPDGTEIRLVNGVSFDLEKSDSLGIVGESGSGKTLTLKALIGLLPRGARAEGSVRLDGVELLGRSERQLAALRGPDVAVIFQDPMTALNPVRRIGPQVDEAPRRHWGMARAQARAHSLELMRRVGLPEPEVVARKYPHELSGGMRQRVMIAIALSCSPRLILCDEPTTALDVTVQAQVLRLLQGACQDLGAAMVFVSHDLAVVRQVCQNLAVMYAGRVVETGPVDAVFTDPRHSYTASLLRALPDVDDPRLPRPISGEPAQARRLPSGCRFHPRCPDAVAECVSWPSTLLPTGSADPRRRSACIHGPGTLTLGRVDDDPVGATEEWKVAP